MSKAARKALQVVFYANGMGTEPVRDWLRGQSEDIRKAIGYDIKTVEIGWPLGMPLVRPMGKGLFEVRSRIPGGIARVLFMTSGATMILLHAFIKKSRETPKSDLDLAIARMKEVKNG